MSGRIGVSMKVGPADTVDEQRVAGKHRRPFENKGYALHRVTRRVEHGQRRVADGNAITVCQRAKLECDSLLSRQMEHRSSGRR